MLVDQEFPVSSEAQLLGGLGEGEEVPICGPGTDVDIDGSLRNIIVLILHQKHFMKTIGSM